MDKSFALFVALFLSICLLSCNRGRNTDPDSDKNSQAKKEARQTNWKSLFDGVSADQWRGFKQEKLPEGWIIEDSNLVALGKGGDLGGDIVSKEQYEDFDLYLEWAISEEGNSGIFFHVLEKDYPTVYATGPEYQLIDDAGYPEGLEPWQQTGANYAMHVVESKTIKPVGAFNSSRIRVKDGQVVHWLNDEKILEYKMWTEDWYRMVEQSKWKDYPAYGRALKGHLALQDHGSLVKFRNIKIMDLTDKGISLFNGTDLTGWRIHGTENWYAENGELICESGPDKQYGYLATEKDFKNFVLRLEFFQESNGNSGVFFRSSIEGTKISGWQVEVAPRGKDTGGIYESYGRGWLYQIPDEMENILLENEWNELVIRVENNRVITWLNNEMMTDLRDVQIGEANGKIALQIHDGGNVKVRWRSIYIKELN